MKSYREYLTEVLAEAFDRPIDYRLWKTVWGYMSVFTLPDSEDRIEVEFEGSKKKGYGVVFSQNGFFSHRPRATKLSVRDSVVLASTILAILKEMIRMADPPLLSFYGNEDKKDVIYRKIFSNPSIVSDFFKLGYQIRMGEKFIDIEKVNTNLPPVVRDLSTQKSRIGRLRHMKDADND